MALLFVTFGFAMGLGTFVEDRYGIATARIWIYNAWWFELLVLFFVVNFIGNIKRYSLQKRENWAVLVLHLSWVFIILGAFVTRYVSDEGLLSLREGETSDTYISDNTYITAFVDGNYKGKDLRKGMQKQVLFSPFARNYYHWKSDFKGKEYDISYVKFIHGVKKDFEEDEKGNRYLKIVVPVGAQREEYYIKDGGAKMIAGALFTFNQEVPGALQITERDTLIYINAPVEGSYIKMRDIGKIPEGATSIYDYMTPIAANAPTELYLRAMYAFGNVEFVASEIVRGREAVLPLEHNEITKDSVDGIVLRISSGGEAKEVTVMGKKGVVGIPTTVKVNDLDFHLSYGSREEQLPFSVRLNDFIATKYPGTERSYASYKSEVTVLPKEGQPFDYPIYMNHILNYKGYRLFQASFSPDEKGTVLSVNHDDLGTTLTYIGYILLFLSLLAFMFVGKSHFRKLSAQLRELQQKRINKVVTVLLLLSVGIASAQQYPSEKQLDSILKATTVSREHAAKFGSLLIQDEGRIKPVNTFSSELLRKVGKRDTFRGMNSDQVLLSMLQVPAMWYYFDIMYVKKDNDSLHNYLGVKKGVKRIPAISLYKADGGYKLAPFLEKVYATNNPNQFEKDIKEVDQRLGLLNRALYGEIFKIFPVPADPNHRWISRLDYVENSEIVKDTLYGKVIREAIPVYLSLVKEGIRTGDYSQADNFLEGLKQNQLRYSKMLIPSETKIKAELWYNKINVFEQLFQAYLYVSLLLFTVLVLAVFSSKRLYNRLLTIGKTLLWLFFIAHTAGLIVRWYISGHAPFSDAYESMIYVAWSTMGAGLLFGRRSWWALASTSFVSSMLLMIAHWNWLDPSIGTLQPVLNSYWLMLHVAVIVGSYGPFALGAILGALSMLLMIFTTIKNRDKVHVVLKELLIVNELSLTVGLVMLTIGNFLGGMWANESWGRYWGWDPKETWALVSIMVYALVIHLRLVPGMRGKWLFSLMSLLAFFSILMTYFGVNFYLSGMHSYASGEKIITPTFVYYAVGVVILLAILSYIRNKRYEN